MTRFSGKPYASCPLASQHERLCSHCLAPSTSAALKRCTRCNWARYCGAVCQRADWTAHKHECSALSDQHSTIRRLPDSALTDMLLTARAMWRRHLSKGQVDDDAFDAMEDGVASKQDHELGKLAASIPGLLPPVSDPADTAAKLIAAFTRNNFGVLNELLSVVAAGCYPHAALLNHSCAPNCVLAFDGDRIEIRTTRPVARGEELTHSYVDLCLTTAERREILRGRYGFDCSCQRCTRGLSTSTGDDVEVLMTAPNARASESVDYALERSACLLDTAAREESDEEESRLTMLALKLRRDACHPLNTRLYEAEGRALTIALATGDMAVALACCRNAVTFLEAVLAHVPAHPLLALQRFTLADLESACGNASRAQATMEACASALELTAATHSTLRGQARERLRELRASDKASDTPS